jgi:hypothetical protein
VPRAECPPPAAAVAAPNLAGSPIQPPAMEQATGPTLDENRRREEEPEHREQAILKQVFINNLELQEQISACRGISE